MHIAKSTLFEIAESQQGYFTFKQAIAAGFSDKNHRYHVQNGDWIKVLRGIYRLSSRGKRRIGSIKNCYLIKTRFQILQCFLKFLY
ncbi:MAG: type IV toxin-antitoxin system AbiEi family antitoxin domain-containing protein [Candidatus Rhabdochlamydia sp.]